MKRDASEDVTKGLSELELEQYELVLEEQAYPFEDKAINVHEKNLELLAVGIYNEWIDKSIEKLAVLMPARYAKAETQNDAVELLVPLHQQPDKPKPAQQPPVAEPAVQPTVVGSAS